MVEYKRAPTNVINLRAVVLDRVFSVLSDTTRRRLVRTLGEREYSVSELAEPFDMSLAAVSKHLSVLEQAGLIRRRKDGRTRQARPGLARLSCQSAHLSICLRTSP